MKNQTNQVYISNSNVEEIKYTLDNGKTWIIKRFKPNFQNKINQINQNEKKNKEQNGVLSDLSDIIANNWEYVIIGVTILSLILPVNILQKFVKTLNHLVLVMTIVCFNTENLFVLFCMVLLFQAGLMYTSIMLGIILIVKLCLHSKPQELRPCILGVILFMKFLYLD